MRRGWGLVAIVGLVFVLVGCSREAPGSTRSLLVYPGAGEVRERVLGADDDLLGIYKAVTFSTRDAPEAVLKFYRDKLTEEGWEVDTFQPDPEALTFRWQDFGEPPATYLMDVAVRAGDAGGTDVEVEMRLSASAR